MSDRPSPRQLVGDHIRWNFSNEIGAKRKRSTVADRLSPCECCGYPISQRHHVVEFSKIGESTICVRLCANCHEAYRIIHRDEERILDNERSRRCMRYGEIKVRADLAFISTLAHVHPDRVAWLNELSQIAREQEMAITRLIVEEVRRRKAIAPDSDADQGGAKP